MKLLNSKRHRSGSVLIAVIICLGFIGILLFSAVQVSHIQRRQLDRELQMEQTRLLTEAGLAYAQEMVKSTDKLPETATIIRPKIDGYDVCEINIEFETKENRTKTTVSAWVGIEDRPELRTKHQLTQEVKTPSGK